MFKAIEAEKVKKKALSDKIVQELSKLEKANIRVLNALNKEYSEECSKNEEKLKIFVDTISELNNELQTTIDDYNKYCEEHDINIPKPGGDDTSRSLDCRYGLQNYVRLSFCSDLPMMYRLQQQGYNLVLLKVKIDVATFEDTLFSDMNATDNNHSCGGEVEDLLNVNFKATKKRYVSKADKDFKYHQAEVLIKKKIDLKYIINIDDPIYL